jgi:hypothetical protein
VFLPIIKEEMMMRICHKCHKRKLVEVTYERSLDIAGLTFVGGVPSLKCSNCGEEIIPIKGLLAFDLVVAMKLIHGGVDSGEAHRFCRKAIGIGNKAIAALYGVELEEVDLMEAPDVAPAPKFWLRLVPLVRAKFDKLERKPVVKIRYE